MDENIKQFLEANREVYSPHAVDEIEIDTYKRENSLRGRISKRLKNLTQRERSENRDNETGTSKMKNTKPDKILEQMENGQKLSYTRKSEESRLERAWNYCFEPECRADDGVLSTFWKGGRETLGDFLKGAAAPYAIPTAKRISGDVLGSKSTSKAKVAGALASAVLAAYITVGSPIYQNHVANEEAKALAGEVGSLRKDRAKIENEIYERKNNAYGNFSPKMKRETESSLQGIEKKILIAQSKANRLADESPIGAGNFVFPSLLALTNALSAFYENRRKKSIDDGMSRIYG